MFTSFNLYAQGKTTLTSPTYVRHTRQQKARLRVEGGNKYDKLLELQ